MQRLLGAMQSRSARLCIHSAQLCNTQGLSRCLKALTPLLEQSPLKPQKRYHNAKTARSDAKPLCTSVQTFCTDVQQTRLLSCLNRLPTHLEQTPTKLCNAVQTLCTTVQHLGTLTLPRKAHIARKSITLQHLYACCDGWPLKLPPSKAHKVQLKTERLLHSAA